MEQPKLLISYKPKLDKNSIPVILWNLFPFLGVLFLNWKPESVFICYALETIVVGGFNVFRMVAVYYYGLPPKPDETGVTGLAMIPFFVVHYFFFVFIQLAIFFSGSVGAGSSFGPAVVMQVILSLMQKDSYNISLVSFVVNNALGFVNDFILNGKYTKRTMAEQMFEPYPRIFVQQLVVIVGGFIFSVTGNGYPVLVIFVVIKIYLDLLLKDFDISQIHNIAKNQVDNSA